MGYINGVYVYVCWYCSDLLVTPVFADSCSRPYT